MPTQKDDETLELERQEGDSISLIHASACAVDTTSNEWTFFIGHFIPRVHETPETICILQMSPQTAKDLYLVMERALKEHEEEYGTIETQYAREVTKKEKQ